MARPNIPLLDNFNRADGAIGANWTASQLNDSGSAFAISGNIAMGVNHSEMWWSAASFANTGGIACGFTLAGTLPSKQASGNFNGWYLDILQQPSASSSTADGYSVGLMRRTGTDTIVIWRYLNAAVAATLLTEVALASDLVIGDTFDLEVKTDGTINVYRNGSIIKTVTDTTNFHAGESAFMGMEIVNAGSANVTGCDDFYGGQITATGVSDSPIVVPARKLLVPSGLL